MARIAIKTPSAREPASPIRSRLGFVLNQRYARRTEIIMMPEPAKPPIVQSIAEKTVIAVMERMVSVPDSPSTPSVQLVTLMATQTRTVPNTR